MYHTHRANKADPNSGPLHSDARKLHFTDISCFTAHLNQGFKHFCNFLFASVSFYCLLNVIFNISYLLVLMHSYVPAKHCELL